MNDVNKEKREFLRTKVKRLTSIIKHEGVYKLIEEDETSTPTLINIKDIETLDSALVKCEVIRSLFNDGNHTYNIGLRFRPPNTEYLKQLVELLKVENPPTN